MYHVYGAKVGNPLIKGLVRENRVIWFCEEAGIPYDRISIDPGKGENKSPEYSRLNPFNKVPTLVIENKDSDGNRSEKVLTQSAAIVWYLAQTHKKLIPSDSWESAKAMEWMMFILSDIEPHCGPLQLQLKMVSEIDLPHAQWMAKRAEGLLSRAFDYLEGALKEEKFILGDSFSAVDVILGCTVLSIRDHGIFNSRPKIKALLGRYYLRPAFLKTWEINGTYKSDPEL